MLVFGRTVSAEVVDAVGRGVCHYLYTTDYGSYESTLMGSPIPSYGALD